MNQIVLRRIIFQLGRPSARFALTCNRRELPVPRHFSDTTPPLSPFFVPRLRCTRRARQQQNGNQVALRGDAAFAKPEIYQALEDRGVKCAIRLPANGNLERDVEELLISCVRQDGRARSRWCATTVFSEESARSLGLAPRAITLGEGEGTGQPG